MTNEPTAPITNITINLDALLNKVVIPIGLTAQSIAYGLTVSGTSTPETITMPGTILENRFAPNLSISQVKDMFENWVVRMGLGEYVAAYHGFLESVCEVSSLVEYSPSEGWDQFHERQRFNRMNFPDKLDYIDNALGTNVDPDLRARIESINRARNCFEHRRGFVGEADLRGDQLMVVSWRGMEFRVHPADPLPDEQGSLVTELPILIRAGESLKGVVADRSKSFELGQNIAFSAAEITDIGYTFIFHAQSMIQAVKEAIPPS